MDEYSPEQGAGKGLGAPAGLEIAAGAVVVLRVGRRLKLC